MDWNWPEVRFDAISLYEYFLSGCWVHVKN